MNLPPQPPSSEETEQPIVLPSSEEASTLPISTSSDSLAEETEYPFALPSSEEASTLPMPTSSDSLAEETTQTEVFSSEPDGAEASILDEDEDFESPAQSLRSGVFIHRGLLIAVASALVLIALLATLLVFVNRPKDPPTDWIATSIPAAGSTSTGKTLYYLHWANQNGDLKGQMQLAAKVNKAPQSLTVVATGLYNRDNHIIYVIVIINGQPNTLTGKINDNNDTLTLNLAGAPDQSTQIVFHTGNADDYKQAVKKLV